MLVEVRGRWRAREGVRTPESMGRSADPGGGARRPPTIGGVDDATADARELGHCGRSPREGARTPTHLGHGRAGSRPAAPQGRKP